MNRSSIPNRLVSLVSFIYRLSHMTWICQEPKCYTTVLLFNIFGTHYLINKIIVFDIYSNMIELEKEESKPKIPRATNNKTSWSHFKTYKKPEQRLISQWSDSFLNEWRDKRQKEILFFEENANWNEDIIFDAINCEIALINEHSSRNTVSKL